MSSSDPFTSDNCLLSRPSAANAPTPTASAVNCNDRGRTTAVTRDHVSDLVAQYVRHGLADNTLRAYRSDLEHFAAWGGTIPATGESIASYLAEHAEILKVATLVRRLSSISVAHE